ncbi:MAG: hypothetical protein ACLFRX_12220, partial [Gemmatimonadota bacterium]
PGPIVARGSGGRLAAPVWGRAMRRLDAGAANDWRRPEAVVERPIDPASGLVLAEGCRPETGSPATEIFLASDLPAETCPAGERAEPGFFRRIARGAGDLGRRVVAFVAGLFEGDRDEADREGDRYLGRPRLPRAAETRRVAEPDTAPTEREEPLGVPLDSLPGWGDVPPARQPGPEPGDSAPVDTLPR